VATSTRNQARVWAAEGFTEKTAAPWRLLPVKDAAYLARLCVDPALLQMQAPFEDMAEYSLASAVRLRLITVERVYELLVGTGYHTPVASADVQLAVLETTVRSTAPVPLVAFSSAESLDLQNCDDWQSA
jgi:hypothetical protein